MIRIARKIRGGCVMAAEVTQIRSSSLTVNELFSKPYIYRIPDYQRDYSWEDEQVDALWDDITLQYVTARNPNEYFIGTIVVSRDNKQGEKVVVDGQQRLTTITMIMAAIRNIWSKRGDDRRAQGVAADYLGKEDRKTGDIKPRLILNENNNPTFVKYVLEDEKAEISKSVHSSNRLLVRALERIESHIEKWIEERSRPVDDLLGIEEFIGNNLTIILIEAASDADAFIIFETLNDRGLALAVSDLVKNYLFSKGGTYISQFKRQWNDIAITVNQDEISKFLRYYMMSQGDFVRERDLYRAIRTGFPGTGAVRKLLDKLEGSSRIYAALSSSDSSYWKTYDPKLRDVLDALSIYKVSTYKIAAMSAFNYLSPEIALSVLRMLEVISFRITIAGTSNSGQIEKIYSNAAGEIAKGRVKNARDAFELLKDLYIPDREFEEAFKFYKTGRTQLTRYILARINDYLEEDPVRKTEHGGKISLEHIYPKSPNESWHAAFSTNDEIALVNNIGNVTLLETGLNRQIANEAFSYKKEKALSKSSLKINESVSRVENWTPRQIEIRAAALANKAAQIWRLDF
ncbi:DUF262 domain-containing protein [Deinococcus sp. 23YEL01]|uniref:DUF262 domain-containing protein n=1 Tax=Deinococcus sp. 23YEL01 TaxID=2745871 RepID=UPI001E600B9A|nr:DUF262 domain-containing protein [Deinococcus sp. 23YEL01]MCD0168445.1 DUF262 domain-containing protein [Deinococcus sp. 23YEL01]